MASGRRLDIIIVSLLAATIVSGLTLAVVTLRSFLNRNTADLLIPAIGGKSLHAEAAEHSKTDAPEATLQNIPVPILLIAATRPNVSRAIDNVLKYRELWMRRQAAAPRQTRSISHFPLITSVDGACGSACSAFEAG
jgi:hypothetical protein